MNWEPARADHSIDRVVASISLREPIGADDFDKLVLRGRKAARDHQLVDRVDLPDMIAPPPGSDGVFIGLDNFRPSRRVVFKRTDASGAAVEELSISMQQLSFSTLRYRRWPNFFHFITSTVAALDQDYPISQSVRLVRLEYVDRFQSAPEGADHFEVISKDSVFLAPIVKDKTAALHVHSGWFDFRDSEHSQIDKRECRRKRHFYTTTAPFRTAAQSLDTFDGAIRSSRGVSGLAARAVRYST